MKQVTSTKFVISWEPFEADENISYFRVRCQMIRKLNPVVSKKYDFINKSSEIFVECDDMIIRLWVQVPAQTH